MTMANMAPDPVKCSSGGKHQPRSVETKIDGKSVKYELCRKCDLRVGDRKR